MTKTIRLGSLVTCVHYRSPTLLARIVADVDRQSGGRVVLGIGSGDNEHEFAQLGIAFPSLRDRQAALEEALRIVRGVWADTPLTCEGDYFRVTDSQVSPGPAQQPSVPILIAGGGERVTLRQVARYADASNFGPGSVIGNAWTLEDVRRKCKALQRYCDAVGRPFNSVLRTYFGGIAALGDGVAAEQRRFRTGIGVYDIFAGTPHDAIAHFRALLDAGMQYFIVGFLQDPFAQSQILAEKVIPELTAG
jgi:alkanesulfonate monooxygenase SsuD/methylene tetrahydromethanopterin reductase-like flavin-dependent oxidoreductase (luciferase family)